jgi:hypothetical protein
MLFKDSLTSLRNILSPSLGLKNNARKKTAEADDMLSLHLLLFLLDLIFSPKDGGGMFL